MAKTKSSSGSKGTRGKKNEAGVSNPVVVSEVSPVNLTPAKAEVIPVASAVTAKSISETKSVLVPVAVKAESAKPEVVKLEAAKEEEIKTESAKPERSKAESNGKIFEVKKPEVRKNLVPISIEDEIRRRAYELAEQRGFAGGSEAEDWLRAEHEVMQRYHQQQQSA